MPPRLAAISKKKYDSTVNSGIHSPSSTPSKSPLNESERVCAVARDWLNVDSNQIPIPGTRIMFHGLTWLHPAGTKDRYGEDVIMTKKGNIAMVLSVVTQKATWRAEVHSEILVTLLFGDRVLLMFLSMPSDMFEWKII